MAAALQLPASLNVGEELTIQGTGFATTHSYTVTITTPAPGSPDVAYGGTTSGGGAIDTTNKLTLTMNHEGNVSVSVNDGSTTVTGVIPVWRVG